MSAGIVDHETHTRDIKRLGGLRKLMPITTTIACLAALSMAGIPLFNGFLSKEMMLEAVSKTEWWEDPLIVPVLATIGALLSVAYSFRFIVHTFFGPVRDDYPSAPHDPPFGMWAAPAFLVVLVIVIGVFSSYTVGPLVAVAADAVYGGGEAPYYALKIWHGFTPALYMSVAAVIGGLILLLLHRPLDWLWNAVPRPEAKTIFEALLSWVARGCRWISEAFHNGAISRYLAIFAVTTVALGYIAWAGGGMTEPTREMIPLTPVAVIGWVLLVAASLYLLMIHHNRFRALIVVSIIGLMISFGFVYFSAPDLALTQISVETVTILLLLLALYFLPQETPRESPLWLKLRDGVIAIASGGAVAALAYAFLVRDVSVISDFHLANSYSGGGGTNVVNVILVDFRGYDTYGEIIVLGIAGLTIFALMDSLMNGKASRRLRNWAFAPNRSRDRHPLMMVIATRLLMPITGMVGVYILLRGHNQPGGGFVAGLIFSIGLLMQYMASGFAWAENRQRIQYHSMIGFGVIIAGLTGAGAWLAGRPFLTSAFGYVNLPPIEEFELATAFLFDIGVFATVLGAVMLTLYSLSRIARHAGETTNPDPMDYDPSRRAGLKREVR